MGETYYLEKTKQIYGALKESVLTQAQRRTGEFISQVVDPAKVHPDFRLHVGDLCYRLSHYKRLLDIEDSILKNQPYEIRSKLEKEILSTYGDKICEELNTHAKAIEPLCKSLSALEHSQYKTYFQERLLDLVTFQSEAAERAYNKPNGYAGDYKLMEAFASENIYQGKTLYEKCIYRWSVTWPSAAPVKSRLQVIHRELKESVESTLQKKDRIRMLDLACGPAIPVQWMMQEEISDKMECFFLDQDAEAIGNLQSRLRDLKEQHGRKTQFHYYNQSIQKLLSDPKMIEELKGQDFIVSSGLFDYLDDNLAQMLVQVLYSLLNPGGTLLIGNLSSDEPTTAFQWYIVEWPLYFRTQEEVLALAPEGVKANIIAEELGYNLFLKIISK